MKQEIFIKQQLLFTRKSLIHTIFARFYSQFLIASVNFCRVDDGNDCYFDLIPYIISLFLYFHPY